MRFSIRELVVLTVYAALIAAPLNGIALVMAAGIGAVSFFMAMFLAIASLQCLFKPAGKDDRWFLLPVCCLGFLMVAPALANMQYSGSPSNVHVRWVLAIWAALTASALPVLVALDTRNPKFGGRMLKLTFWALCAAALCGGLTEMFVQTDFSNQTGGPNLFLFRPSMLSGAVASTMVIWLGSPAAKRKQVAQSTEPATDPFDSSEPNRD